jgi:hypothetical protein
LQDNARKLAWNNANEAQLREGVVRHGRFRAPVLRPEGFRNRVFSRHFGAPKTADHFESGVVVDSEGKQHTLKLVQPLGRDRRGEPEEEPPVPPTARLWRGIMGAPPRHRHGPRVAVARRGAVRADGEPAREAGGRVEEPPEVAPEPPGPVLPADPAERLRVLKRFKNLLIKLRFRPPEGDDREFFDHWKAVMPATRSLLDKAVAAAEAAMRA